MVAPKVFRHSQAGAPLLSGATGTLIEVLSSHLIINRLFTTANDIAFNNHTTEARLEGGTAFTLFPTPATTDRAYFGMSQPFEQVKFDLATLGIGGTYVWEYWNGATWTQITSGFLDGTSGFTQDGTVSWTLPLSGWATTSVNGVTLFWVRVRPASVPSTNPTVNFATTTGWTEAFTGVSKRAYRMGAGNGLFLRVQDDGPGAGSFREARIRGFESMSDVDTGTGDFPTVAQAATGIFARKSATLDGTSRPYVLVCDDRTFYFMAQTGDVASAYFSFAFGDLFSVVGPSDAFRTMIMARSTENSAAANVEGVPFLATAFGAIGAHYVARDHTGTGGSHASTKHGDSGKAAASNALAGVVEYLNAPDGGLYLSPIWWNSGTNNRLRGRLRGFWHFLHAATNTADTDTFSGVGVLAGKTFLVVKNMPCSADGVGIFETSNSWETN